MLTRLFPLLLLTVLTACSTFDLKDGAQAPADNWSISGKIGVTTPQESVAGFLSWEQTGQDFDIYVSGPFSVGSTRIEGNIEKISLTQNGETVSGINPQHLIYEQLGWYFPIENLQFWLMGQAAPYSPAKTKTKDDQLSQIQQDQWRVDYLRYDAYYELPQRIRISQGEWKFLIVVKNWSIN